MRESDLQIFSPATHGEYLSDPGEGGVDAQQGIWQEQADKQGGEVPPSHTVFSVDAESLSYGLGQDRSVWLFHFLL